MSDRLRGRLRAWWCGLRGHDWGEFGRYSATYRLGHEHICLSCYTTTGVIWDYPEDSRDDHCSVCRPRGELTMAEYTPSEEHKLTYTWGGRGCVCGWSSGPQKTYNEGDRLAAAHMKEANHGR